MITISKIVDSAALAVGRLASEFKEAIKLNGMVTALANEAQAVENAFWDLLLANRDVAVATGATLDNIGRLVGAPVRGPRNDASYRLRIIGQIAINRSGGETGSIYAIAKGLVAAWNVVNQPRVRETGTAQYTIGCGAVSFAIPTPTGLAFGTQITTGGTLAGGLQVSYRVSALRPDGETLAATEITRTLDVGTNTNQQPIQWNAVAGASGYKVYGRTAGGQLFMATVAATVFPGLITFTDNGSITPSGALPGAATANFSNDTALVNDTNEARELANVLVDASSAGVRSIVRSRSSTQGAPGFFRFAGGTGTPRGFGDGGFIGAYDR